LKARFDVSSGEASMTLISIRNAVAMKAAEQAIAAQAAAQRKRMVEAERLALESRVGAELASAKTETVKAKAVNDEMKRSTDKLTEEMQRKTGDKQ
jgi:hypothetical protein